MWLKTAMYGVLVRMLLITQISVYDLRKTEIIQAAPMEVLKFNEEEINQVSEFTIFPS